MKPVTYKPIGIIRSPFRETRGTPIQPAAGKGVRGHVELFPEFIEGLKDLDSFSHIMLIFHLHLSRKVKLTAKPYMENEEHGIFAIRGPSRPNPIGISRVRLTGIKGNILYIQDLDIVDGTPLLDIKPWVPAFDAEENIRTGWLEKNVHKLPEAKDDGRFSE